MTETHWRARRVLLIGQAPGPTGPPPGRPLVGGKSGTYLQMLAGCETLKEYIKRFETRNVLDKYPGRSEDGKGDKFPMAQARAAADAIEPSLRGRRVIFVGQKVMEVFRRPKWSPSFEWLFTDSDWTRVAYEWAWMPHPSPINRFWNIPENVARAKIFFAGIPRG